MNTDSSRRSFLVGGALSAATLAAAGPLQAATLNPAGKKGLAELMAGNARFVADKPQCPPMTARRLELAHGQSPFATIVSCSDSRAPVETIFDQVPGNIFGVRIAGNFVDDDGLGSIEYSVAVLKASLVLILGHTDCGAIKATVKFAKDGKAAPSHIQRLVEALLPAAKSTKGNGGDWVEHATVQNVKENAAALASRSPILASALAEKRLSIASGIYDLHSGRVTIVS